jgi:uncharacterized protein YciI
MKQLIIAVLVIVSFWACSTPPSTQADVSTIHKSKFDSSQAPSHNDKRFGEMRTYYLVLLNSGPTRNQDSTQLAQLMEGHLNHIKAMVDLNKIVIAGPMLDNTNLRGIFIFNSTDSTEVDSLVNLDPAIQAGRLTAEIHPWYSASGACLPE